MMPKWEYFVRLRVGWAGLAGFLDGLPILLLQSSGRVRGRWYRAPLRRTPRVPRLGAGGPGGGPGFAGPPMILKNRARIAIPLR